jgi:diacylglycerol kinase
MKARSVFESIKFAFQGLHHILSTQRNARVHAIITILVILLGFWLKIDFLQWSVLLIAISVVWITESFNTALENLFNLVQPELHDFAKNGKDSSAAAVLVATILSIFLGLIALGPPLISKLFR